MTSRSIPSSVAAVLQELELEQPVVVTKDRLEAIAARVGVSLTTSAVAERLQRHGWLLPLRTREAWEFAPAARAGPFGCGDPFVEVRATMERRPALGVVVAYESAAWLHQFAVRSPRQHVLSIPSEHSVPHALRGFRVTRMEGNLAVVDIRGLAVWRLETLIVLIGTRPRAFRDWPNIGEWLPAAVSQLDERAILEELQGRPRSAWMRTGYVLETGGGHRLASLRDRAPAGSGPYYLGSRQAPGRYNTEWDVHDSALRYRHIQSTDGAASTSRQR